VRELADLLNSLPDSGFTLPANKSASLKAILHTLQTFNPQPYKSLRAALAQ